MKLKHRPLSLKHAWRPNKRRSRRQGASAVEFAICLPIVLLMFFGSIEFSRVNMLRHTVAEAAYEGARRGIVPGATAAEARDEAIAMLRTGMALNYTVTVAPTTITPQTTEVTVSISLPIEGNSWMASRFFKNKTLSHSFTMRRERHDTATVP